MIDPKYIITYAQYNEDVILSTLMDDVQSGFYVDVGASYPTIDSVTRMFYDKGWSGINIEPIRSVHGLLEEERPRDINLNCGVGKIAGTYNFREYLKSPGHSTFDEHQKRDTANKKLLYKDYSVEVRPLQQILLDNKVGHIHFLKIDVEGYEYQVIESNDWIKYRPEIICIESNHISKDWRPILDKNNYKLFISDGLNEYHIAEEHWHRTKNFAERVIESDYHALKQHQWQSWMKDSQDLKQLIAHQIEMQKTLDGLNQQLEDCSRLSLKDKGLRGRLRIAIYGIAIDWYKFKKREAKK